MPDEEKNLRGSLLLDFVIWWRQAKARYSWPHICQYIWTNLVPREKPWERGCIWTAS